MLNMGVVLLAAGQGKRMKSSHPKVMQEVLFKPMVDWVIDAAKSADIQSICVVAGYAHEQLENHLAGGYEMVVQKELLGTGHAVMQAREFIKKCSHVLILNGDAPFITPDAIRLSYQTHKENEQALTVITAKAANPLGYGRIVRAADGSVKRIVEEKDADAEQKKIAEINSGAYWFESKALLEALDGLSNDNAQREYYLTDTVEIINKMGLQSGTCMMDDERIVAGANDRRQLAQLNAAARRIMLDRLYDAGVSIVDESGVVVGPDVKVGRDTILLPGTILRGHTEIGEGCLIGPNSLLEDCVMGDNVKFNASQAYHSRICDGVTVGPFAHIRPNCVLHDLVHVGDFVELKNSDIGDGSKVPHLTYVGDSDVGRKVNFGCGCVTSNYDGVKKYRTKVGDNAFIGCNTNLIAPVEVGESAYTAAGSTITKNVPANALAVARSRQQNLEGWVLRKRPKK